MLSLSAWQARLSLLIGDQHGSADGKFALAGLNACFLQRIQGAVDPLGLTPGSLIGDTSPWSEMMKEPEAELVGRAVAGDADALSELLHQFGPAIGERLAAQIRPQIRSAFDIEDVLQITYLEAFLRIGTFSDRGPGAFEAWLNQIATNNLRDALRELDRKKRPPVDQRIVATGRESESGAVGLLDRIGWTSTTPSRCASEQEQQALVLAALDGLPPDYSRVLRMYELEGCCVETVAESMGRSVGAVYMLRARAIDRLRDALSGSSGIPGEIQ